MNDPAIRPINPEGGPPPGGHYSHGTVATGFVFVARFAITPVIVGDSDRTFEAADRTGRRSTRSTRNGPAPRSRRAPWCRCPCCTTG
jgi:hypothetical protein